MGNQALSRCFLNDSKNAPTKSIYFAADMDCRCASKHSSLRVSTPARDVSNTMGSMEYKGSDLLTDQLKVPDSPMQQTWLRRTACERGEQNENMRT